jgi:chitinase
MLIDPTTFNVVPSAPGDILLYHEFTSLKSTRMQTWFSIGGFDFSDPGPTRTTWSDLCANPTNRAAFISSLIDFMNKWGFQGVDLDWEYPGQPDRGGNPQDTPNLLLLIQEMRAAFGNKFGISLAL